jgi:hypothetical protein
MLIAQLFSSFASLFCIEIGTQVMGWWGIARQSLLVGNALMPNSQRFGASSHGGLPTTSV